MLNRRGWDAFRQNRARNLAALPALVGSQLLAQRFIRHRSHARWLAHQLVFWGCILAGLVTIPLTLGLLHFESVGQQADRYQVYISRVGTVKFDAESIVGWLFFHALDIAAVLVLAGVFIFLRRRLRDPGRARDRALGRLPRARRPLRRVDHRAVPHRVEPLPRRTVLRHAEHAARRDGDPRADVHPVRQAVPHLPTSGQPRRRVLQASERPTAPPPCVECAARSTRARSRSPTSKPCSPKSASTTRSTAVAATSRRARDAGELRSRSRSRLASEASADGPPARHRRRAHRALRPAPQRGASRRLGLGRRDRQARDHPLLLLRPAVRHQAEGAQTTRSSASSPGTSSRSTRASSARRA